MQSAKHLWTLSEDREAGLGLSCTEDGLFLGATPLLDRDRAGFAVRAQGDLERLLTAGYRADVALERVMQGLTTVASALNDNNLCRARIAAVHLRIPPLPDALARLDMQLEDVSLTLERIAKTTAAGNWDPAKHPRAGTAPNPGWFAPTDGGDAGIQPTLASDKTDDDGRLHLPPAERNDEIGDLLEWIANANPEDAEAISGEISRIFYQNSDFADGAALHQALIESLANPDPANRQRILDQYEPITRHDPTAAGAVIAETGIITSLRIPGRAPEIAAPAAEAADALSDVWKLGWARRGVEIERALGQNLGPTFPAIDRFENGVATSIKSIGLTSAIYQNGKALLSRINSFRLSEFNGAKRGLDSVRGDEIKSRVLRVAVPKIRMTAEQRDAIEAAKAQAEQYGVTLNLVPF